MHVCVYLCVCVVCVNISKFKVELYSLTKPLNTWSLYVLMIHYLGVNIL